MSFVIILVFGIFGLAGHTFAQCGPEPQLASTGGILKTLRIDKATTSETGLSITALADGTSWQTKGAEAAVVTIFVNDKYNQDIILFSGSTAFKYDVLLGRLDAGNHEVAVVFNRARSAPNAHSVTIVSVAPFQPGNKSTRNNNDEFALENSPIIYARPNSVDKFSDIPLVTYYEIFPEPDGGYRIRYTVIYSNEDGGTQSAALLARWGRLTDIEWVYEIKVKDDKIVSGIYQGADHEPKSFRGRRFGSHPMIFDETDNNNFSDQGCSPLRFAPLPVRADFSNGSRETAMDNHPWTYRIMAEEAFREGRVNPRQLGPNSVDDPRNYLYVEVFVENNLTTVAVEAGMADKTASRSDFGNFEMRVWRTGFARTAVRLASPASRLRSLSLFCHMLPEVKVAGKCQNARIIKFIRLDRNFKPVEKINAEKKSRSISPGEKLTWTLSGN